MAGGSEAGWPRAARVLEAIAARVDGDPCCAFLGADGAGHFTKMVHNGIEYAVMQLIAEAYDVLRRVNGLSAAAMAEAFAGWRREGPDSFLLEITERILREPDPETGVRLVEVIEDEAEQKGTGAWASIAAIELGVPAPTLIEAAQARSLSSLKRLRVELAEQYGELAAAGQKLPLETVRQALTAATLCAYAQGFMLLNEASASYGWTLDLARIAQIWRGGCIIRSELLGPIAEAYAAQPALRTLLEAAPICQALLRDGGEQRRLVAAGALGAIPVPAHGSAVSWLEGLRTARLPANLVQAQRDLFGAHRFSRVDRPGHVHHRWSSG
jgi:6-phosphogluconate dehydrogenase